MLKRFKPNTSSPKRIITPIIETVVLTVSSMILGYFIIPDSGFFSVPSYLCLLMGPLFCGLRYGFTYALNSALFLLGGMWVIATYFSNWNFDVFSSATLGLVLVPVIAGEFRNYWDRKIKKAEAAFSYVDQNLGEITNAFNILKVSHERLAQKTASQNTLRDSIISVQSHIMKAKLNHVNAEKLSSLILNLFADYCSIQQAGYFAVNDSGQIIKTAVAFYGGKFEINPKDLVLKKAVSTLKTTSLKAELAIKEKYKKLILLAIPLVDASGRIWGIVIINKMPYRAFRPENIRLFAILGGYIADIIGMKNHSYFCKDIQLQAFLFQVARCLYNLKSFNIPSSLVIIKIKNKKFSIGIRNLIFERQRGLDKAWSVKNNKGEEYIFILLPLAKVESTYGYKIRLQKIIKEQYNYYSLEHAGIKFHRKNLDNTVDLKEMMSTFFKKYNIEQKYW